MTDGARRLRHLVTRAPGGPRPGRPASLAASARLATWRGPCRRLRSAQQVPALPAAQLASRH